MRRILLNKKWEKINEALVVMINPNGVGKTTTVKNNNPAEIARICEREAGKGVPVL